jgi:hypothetical protein
MVIFCSFLVGIMLFSQNAFSQKRLACSEPHKTISNPAFQWQEEVTQQGKLYILTVPGVSKAKLLVGVSPQLATVESPLWQEVSNKRKPIFIINGGFFDPKNGKTTSYLYKNGLRVGDPHDNRQLVDNPKLEPYLPKIFNRTEFRIYKCNKMLSKSAISYDIVKHEEPVPPDCVLEETLGAGPQLLPQIMSFEEGFVDYNAEGKMTRDPIGVNAKNARSALGIKANGDVLVMMGAQVPEEDKTGFSLQDMADQLKAHGAVKAMSLDGGSSSGLVYRGQVHYGKFNKDDSPVIRPVKSVLMLIE